MRYDVIVSGAGLAGMIAMARFAAAGFSVLGIERNTPAPLDDKDLRSTAFLMPSIEVLKRAGLWSRLENWSTPLDVMEIIDATELPTQNARFDALEIDEAHFGYNVMNAHLHQILRETLQAEERVEMRFESEITNVMNFDQFIALRLSTGERLEARLLIGADGRLSSTRKLLGIKTHSHEFDQWAQVFTVTHSQPHENTSTEVHLSGGPFTLVPRQNIDGEYASAVVWLDHTEAVRAREAMNEEEFHTALNARSMGIRGELKRVSPMGKFPMIAMEAERLNVHRGVIIGEAAHVLPPIGAQGLNLSLRDIESLLRIIERGAIQDPELLQNWARKRKMDISLRERGVSMLNEISIGDMSQSAKLRRTGLRILQKQSPLKRGLMKLGLGA